MRKTFTGLAAAALFAGAVATASPAAADDDRISRSGTCSGSATYKMTVVERDDDRLVTSFRVDGKRAGAAWTYAFFRNGKYLTSVTRSANRSGDLLVSRTFRGDDDDRVRVVAKARYGETCARTLRIDD
jgi:hypothetical protein